MSKEHIDFDYVKRHANFRAVLAYYDIKAPGRGVQLKVLCPFHADTKPSLSVNLGRKVFHCFGCGRRGNVLEFTALMEDVGLDPEEGLRPAALKLSEICGIDLSDHRELPRKAPQQPHRRDGGLKTTKGPSGPRSSPGEAPEAREGPAPTRAEQEAPAVNTPLEPEFIERFEGKLLREHPYFLERGLTPELIERFGLGYYPDEGRGMMRNRVVIPIHSLSGELLAYCGRWVGPDESIPPEKGKYELPKGFLKDLVLYNLNRVRGRRHLVVVEGCFSVFRLAALGLPAVALMGLSFSEHHEALLRAAHVERLTFLLDGDDPGRNAAPAIMARLARSPLRAKFAVLPDGTQPDTAAGEVLRDLLAPSA